MKKMQLAIISSLMIFASSLAMANSDSNVTIKDVGTQTTEAYIRFNETLSTNCLYGVVYLGDLSNTGTKGLYASALSVLASGQKVALINYTQDSTGACLANQIEVGH